MKFLPSIPEVDARGWDEAPDNNKKVVYVLNQCLRCDLVSP